MRSVSARDPVLEMGMEIFERMREERPSVFDKRSWAGGFDYVLPFLEK